MIVAGELGHRLHRVVGTSAVVEEEGHEPADEPSLVRAAGERTTPAHHGGGGGRHRLVERGGHGGAPSRRMG